MEKFDKLLVFKALSDQSRLDILDMLRDGELCACEILEKLSISQSTLSYHMKLLTESKLVNGRKDGNWIHYSLDFDSCSGLASFFNSLLKGDQQTL